MAFCENCGRQLAEGEVCNCTQNQTGSEPNQTQNVEPSKSKRKVKIGLVIAVMVLVVAVVGGMAAFIHISNGYKKPVNNIINVVNKKTSSIDSLAASALPDFVFSSYKKTIKIMKTSEDFVEKYDEAQLSISDMYSQLDESYENGWKLKFDCTDKERLDEPQLEGIATLYSGLYTNYFESICDDIKGYDKYDYEDLADSMGITTSKAKDLCKVAVNLMNEFKDVKVTDGYTLTGRIVMNDNNGENLWRSDKMTIKVIKLNGDWTVDYVSLVNDEGVGIWGIDFLKDLY